MGVAQLMAILPLIQAKGCAFTELSPGQILHGFASGYDPAHQPYLNTLTAAQAWCCDRGPAICGGITHQAGLFDARQGRDPASCSVGCSNVTSWVVQVTPPPELSLPVWPIPRSVAFAQPAHSDSLSVSRSFVVQIPSNSPSALASAAARYQGFIRDGVFSSGDASTGVTQLDGVTVIIKSNSDNLTLETDYSYVLALPLSVDGPSNNATLTAPTQYGAMYGLETLTQIVRNGSVPAKALGVVVSDRPQYRWRGLMIDTGRRFVPKSDVLNALTAMSYAKMSVLHLHLSDDQRCAVESKKYPDLTANLTGEMGGFYTQDDVTEIVAFAKERGVLVVPEVDLPGHANGLLPLKHYGGRFCAPSQMYADQGGGTVRVLTGLVEEYAALFGSQIFHLGCDETTVIEPLCTLNATKSVEVSVSTAVHGIRNAGAPMWPMGWEEFHWRTNASDAVGPGVTGAIIEAWSKYRAADVVKLGYRAVEAYGSKFYLNHLHPVDSQWVDIGEGIEEDEEMQLMLGGEIAMWTPQYKPGGPGGIYYGPSTDATFSKSFGGLVWPRAAVGAGAFWNFNNSWSFSDVEQRYDEFAALLAGRGLFTCPASCACNYTTACGKPYSASNP
eukprot:m.385392 g.385392  ORF g.385392 m.385392 type:complete len:614 (+) comp16737_c4_seq1:44-1885(+)